ncbi:hypothetical protein SCA6_015848, partial [Theobroma cacao]
NTHHACISATSNLQNNPPLVLPVRYISATSNQYSFTVSYLIETFGFSKESALTTSKHVNFETSKKPDSVIAFFKKQGFSKTDITRMIKTRPSLLSDEKTVHAIKRFPRLISYDVKVYLLPNISILNNIGVPQSNIISMFRIQPQILLQSPPKLKEIGDTIKNMGFDPTGKRYLTALFVYSSMTKATWDSKVDHFKKLGWSEEEICKAFHLQPILMKTSEHKITAIMSFLVNKMGFTPSAIVILMSSLEKKIVPRGLFGKDLLSKGYIKNLGLESLFLSPEKVFLNRFVYRYGEASELLKL